MVPVMSLWGPILLAAVIVFLASFILHMVLPFHRNDMRKLAGEDPFLETVQRLGIPPGDYGAPHPGSAGDLKDPVFREKLKRGPIVYMRIASGGSTSMGRSLVLWFLYCVLVGFFSAYVTGRALEFGADYLEVFRFAGTVAFMGYAFALLQDSIWSRRSWGTTIRSMIDGLLYGLLTAGTFGWLWPKM